MWQRYVLEINVAIYWILTCVFTKKCCTCYKQLLSTGLLIGRKLGKKLLTLFVIYCIEKSVKMLVGKNVSHFLPTKYWTSADFFFNKWTHQENSSMFY